MEHGGYRKPSNPAPVSGPGALSRRTDGAQPQMKLPDAKYGEQAQFGAAQSGAPMAQAAQPGGTTPLPSPGSMPNLTPLQAPTERPDEPVTAGAALGPGVGPAALGLPNASQVRQQDAEALRKNLPALIQAANRPDATPSFRNWVRMVRDNLS